VGSLRTVLLIVSFSWTHKLEARGGQLFWRGNIEKKGLRQKGDAERCVRLDLFWKRNGVVFDALKMPAGLRYAGVHHGVNWEKGHREVRGKGFETGKGSHGKAILETSISVTDRRTMTREDIWGSKGRKGKKKGGTKELVKKSTLIQDGRRGLEVI